MKKFFIFLYIITCNHLYSQNNENTDGLYYKNLKDTFAKRGEFYSLSDAEKVHPDSVRVLFLGNTNLKKFPAKILKYKNLDFLSFINFDIKELYIDAQWMLTEKEKLHYIKRVSRNPNLKHERGGWFCKPRKTKIKSIPNEIIQLKKLSSIQLNHYQLSKKKLKRLKLLLPNCTISIK